MITNDARPLRRPSIAGDVARGVGALAALAGLVVGVPFLLLTWGHWPITGLPTWEQVTDLPTTLLSDSTVLGIFTVALWVVWAVFTVAVLAEAVAQARGRRRGALPATSPIHRLAGHLVATVMVALGSFATVSATATPVLPAHAAAPSASSSASSPSSARAHALVATHDEPRERRVPTRYPSVPRADALVASSAGASRAALVGAEPAVAAAPEAAAPATPAVVPVSTAAPAAAAAPAAPAAPAAVIDVERGDSPWGLAEAHLGDGMRWRELWEFNRVRPQPDGGVWANPDDAIRPGWQLAIPGTGVAAGPVAASGVVVPAGQSAPAEDVVVVPDDNFWSLAEGQLVEAWGRQPSNTEVAAYWQDTLTANAGRLLPPRDPDDIYPGEQFVLPPTPVDPLAPPPAPAPPPTSNGSGPSASTPPADAGAGAPAAPADAPEAAAPADAPEAGAGEEAPSASDGAEVPGAADEAAPAPTTTEVPAPSESAAPAPEAAAPAPAPATAPEEANPAPTTTEAPAPTTTAAPAPEAASPAPAPEAAAPTTTAPPADEPAEAPATTAAPAPAGEPVPEPQREPRTATTVPEDAEAAPGAVEEPSAQGQGTPEAAAPAPTPEATTPTTAAAAPAPPTTAAPAPQAAPTTAAPERSPQAAPTTAAPERSPQAAPTTAAPGQAPEAAPTTAQGPTGDAGDAEGGDAGAPGTAGPAAPSAETGTTATTVAGDEAAAPEATEVPAPGSDDRAPGAGAEADDDGADRPLPIGLIGGGLALAGLVLLLDRRRRAQSRHRRPGRRLRMPGAELAAVERNLRAGTDVKAARLVDAALRAAAAGAGVGGPPELRWVESTSEEVTLVVAPPSPPPAGFTEAGPGRWRTSRSVKELAEIGGSASSLAPALVPVGTTEDGTEVLVDLESSGVLSVIGPDERVAPFLRSMALAAATAAWTEQPRVLLVGLGGELTALPWVETAGTLGVALVDAENRAAEAVSALRELQCQTTAQARAAGATPDAWEPLVVVSSAAPQDERYRVAALAARPGHAVAVVCPPGDAVHGRRLEIGEDGWATLADCDLRIRARQLAEDDTRAVVELLELAGDRDGVPAAQAEEPEVRTPAPLGPDDDGFDDEAFGSNAVAWSTERSAAATTNGNGDGHGHGDGNGHRPDVPPPDGGQPAPAPGEETDEVAAPPAEASTTSSPSSSDGTADGDEATGPGAAVPFEPERPSRLADLLADVDVLVKVLGDVEAVRLTVDGEERLVPGRQKALEAMTYLALREVPVDREDLEIVLFPTGANATKTFHNTVAAARRCLGDDLFPSPSGGRYELAEGVVTDYGLFHELVASAEDIEDAERAADLLSEALTLVGGEPFVGAGRGYAWVAPHRGMIVAQVVDVAEEVAEIRLATGDWREAEWAARQGLTAFPCDERMYRLLMRAAHAAGNIPGVHRVFRELCDTVADPDDGTEPEDTIHPETLALLDTLTGGHGRSQASA